MRWVLGIGLIAMMAGCGGRREPPPRDPAGAGAGGVSLRGCVDPPDCTNTNGTGVYTAEEGTAGVGKFDLMITHFINNGSYVSFQGRYFNPDEQKWLLLPTPGWIYGAQYLNQNMHVLQVSERTTTPEWTLENPDPGAENRTLVVTEAGLHDLQLHIMYSVPVQGTDASNIAPDDPHLDQFKLPMPEVPPNGDPAMALPSANGITEYHVLVFSGHQVQTPEPGGTSTSVTTYNLAWRPVDPNAPLTQYCADATRKPDSVVFQQGIDVNPVTGAVHQDGTTAGLVTLSCRLGALATVYSWGYSHFDRFHFDAGIQMKRASYCADAQFFTRAGTHIEIYDDSRRAVRAGRSIPKLEAWWTPQGATCLNLKNMRHSQMASSRGFRFTCPGRSLPPCGAPPAAPYLGDGPETPGP